MAHNPYRAKSYSHAKKRAAYNERRKNEGYPRGGYNRVPLRPYAGEKRARSS